MIDLERVDSFPLHDDAPLEGLASAIERDLEALGKHPDAEVWRLGRATCSIGSLRQSLESIRSVLSATKDPNDATPLIDHVRAKFDVYRSTARSDGALFTGYYEPVLEGRRQRGGAFVHPLYGRPSDLLTIALGDFDASLAGTTLWARVERGKLSPYYSRREIEDGGVLAGRGLEIFWLDDPVSLYFLQVQGSGVIRLGDGSSVRIGFAGSNGRPYTSIGRILSEDGSLGGVPATAPAIQRYLREHPERQHDVFFQNDRYVFFRESPDGPIGRLGVKLTAGRSIAIDPAVYPLGTLAYLDAEVPVVDDTGATGGRRTLRRLVLAQDTGAAITGPGRADVFFGTGERAGLEAGVLSARGELVFLLPRDCTA